MKQPTLFDMDDAEPLPPDQPARDFAVDPGNDVVLEASAGTGKTRVLVERYVRLIRAGIEPRNILAITFTRKAAAEMRDRVLVELRRHADNGTIAPARWRVLLERISDIQISTIDAFCFGLLREFPLEANVDPAFDIADETEMARFGNEAIDLALRASHALMRDDERVRLLFARVKTPVLSQAMRSLVDRRHVALPAVRTFLGRDERILSAAEVGAAFLGRLGGLIENSPHRSALFDDGPRGAPAFRWLAADLGQLDRLAADDPARVQQLRRRLERYFLTQNRKPRQKVVKPFLLEHFGSPAAKKRHEQAVAETAPLVLQELERLDRDVNRLLARGLLRVLTIAVGTYERLLEEHGLLDFAAMLSRSVALLEDQEEFARSRLKLQARYHHVLVDEFQDTSRMQWRLVELLINAWGEGEGTADAPTSIFVVGDRKQSIYRFRHAEVTLLDEAARRIAALRPGRTARQVITTSFRAVPELLAFVNALATGMAGDRDLDERFTYDDRDRFPVPPVSHGARRDGQPVLGLVASPSMDASAAAVADEIARLIGHTVVRDRSGGSRAARADDIAILFRVRAGHQYFEDALEARNIRSYVYKGLGFFDAPEVQDLQALLRYLAQPDSDLRAAEFLRSRVVRLSDVALTRLAPHFAAALGPAALDAEARLGSGDRALLDRARAGTARWRTLADRIPPSELVDLVLRESAYVFEMRGRRLDQARENVKKVRALIRRVENRGYATLGRLAAYFDTLRAGDESNAVVEASGAVNLMTIHAAKGLEFPIVFLVNLQASGRGQSGGFSVIERGPGGEPEVAFNQTDATRLEEQRESEELRRLFYVAATRARDRLYLATEIDRRGKLRRPARSLASLLPERLAEAFVAATTSLNDDEVVWTTEGGSFAFRICRAEPGAIVSLPLEDSPPAPLPVVPLVPTGRRIVPATSAVLSSTPALPRTRSTSRTGHERVVGTLVHRLFQRQFDANSGDAELAAAAIGLIGQDERADIGDTAQLGIAAATLFRAFRQRPDVVRLLDGGNCFYEVPFSYEPPDRPGDRVRGAVDCLVVGVDGSATVLEFKTGQRRPEHEAQSQLYAEAMAAALGLKIVRSLVLYP